MRRQGLPKTPSGGGIRQAGRRGKSKGRKRGGKKDPKERKNGHPTDTGKSEPGGGPTRRNKNEKKGVGGQGMKESAKLVKRSWKKKKGTAREGLSLISTRRSRAPREEKKKTEKNSRTIQTKTHVVQGRLRYSWRKKQSLTSKRNKRVAPCKQGGGH